MWSKSEKRNRRGLPHQILPKGKPIKAKALGRESFDVIYRRGKPLVRHGHIEIRGKRIAPLPPRVKKESSSTRTCQSWALLIKRKHRTSRTDEYAKNVSKSD